MAHAPRMQQIKASAGSGKTYEITQQFLELLAKARLRAHTPFCGLVNHSQAAQKESAPPLYFGDILAITFTNAAAQEMKDRIMGNLKKIALDLEKHPSIDKDTAKQWVQTILRQYGALNVRTIDSLLHLIVRTAALDLELPPDFESAFATEEVLTPIFENLLEQIWHDEGTEKSPVEHVLENVCKTLLFREKSKGFATGARIHHALALLIEMAFTEGLPPLSSVAEIQSVLDKKTTAYSTAASTLLNSITQENISLHAQAAKVFQLCAEGDTHVLGSAYLRKETCRDCALKKSKDAITDEIEQYYHDLCQKSADLARNGTLLHKSIEYIPFVELTKIIFQNIQSFQQRERVVLAAIIPLLAQRILSLEYGVPTALCRLGSRIQHIMLDEFQDTNRLQWKALSPLLEESLSRGGSLTWVGDVKQAIYGWRGGDAELFDAVCHTKELTQMVDKVEQKNLPTNWRSRQSVVNTNNTLFTALQDTDTALEVLTAMLAQDCPPEILQKAAQKLSLAFSDAKQNIRPDYATEGDMGGYVSMQNIGAEDSAELEENVREALHARLKKDLGQRRSWGEITILTRSNEAASKVSAWLMEWQVPAITENSLLLGAHPLINETIALLQFLDCPQDNLAFWTILSGSILAETPHTSRPPMHELLTWALESQSSFLHTSFKELWPDFWQEIFDPFYASNSLLSPYNCVQEWFRILRVQERFPEAKTFLRRFLEVVHAAEGRGCYSLSTFLHHWQEHGDKEKAPMPDHIDAVRIMTIHKSKGLQFKVVIIPWLSFTQKDARKPIFFEMEGLQLLAPCCKEMGTIFYEQQADNAIEALNTLYVACTRAEEELHIFHTHTEKLLRMRNLACGLEVLLPKSGFALPYISGMPISTKSDTDTHPQPIADTSNIFATSTGKTLPASAEINQEKPMQWLPRLKIYRNPLQNLLPPETLSEQDKAGANLSAHVRGTLLHRCLEYFISRGPEHAEEDAKRAVQLGLHVAALPPSFTQSQHKALRDEFVCAITWYATLPGIALWSKYALPEHSILDADNKSYRVDALIPPREGFGWRAIDYKTGQEYEKNHTQMQQYLTLLDALPFTHEKPLPPSQGMLIYLDTQECCSMNSKGKILYAPEPIWQIEE